MSDFDQTANPGGSDAPAEATTDVTGDSSTPDTGSDSDIFSGVDFDKTFGLTPDDKPAEVDSKDTSDVPTATDPPSPRQAEEIVPAGEEAEAKADDKPEADAKAPKEGQFTPNEKLNWDDDKVPFRKEYDALKAAYLTQLESNPESQFINDPAGFASWMKETSPTSFNEIGTHIATESAQSHPEEWIQFFATNHPDLLAQAATGRDDITAERLKAELEVILDEDDEDVQAVLEKNKALEQPAGKPTETPEQKEVRQWREQKSVEEYQTAISEVFGPIETAVDALVSQAGLEIKESDYKGKPFDSLDEETQFKVLVNDVLIPSSIDYFVKNDPKLVAMQSRLEYFLSDKDDKGNPKARDIASAKKLQHAASIVATNATNTALSLITNRIAAAKEADTKSPVTGKPTPMVRSAGAAAPAPPTGTPTKDDWAVTEADLR